MGTRSITMVIDKQGEVKIAQYGQWDGYPEGQGKTILKFLKAKTRRNKLEKQLSKITFSDDKTPFITEYNKRVDAGTRTDEDKIWFSTFITRDIGGEILRNVADSKLSNIILLNSGDRETDQWVQWVYIIDYKKNILSVHFSVFSPAIKEYDLDNLPSVKTFVDELNKIYYEE
jgi:hypothetical protein